MTKIQLEVIDKYIDLLLDQLLLEEEVLEEQIGAALISRVENMAASQGIPKLKALYQIFRQMGKVPPPDLIRRFA